MCSFFKSSKEEKIGYGVVILHQKKKRSTIIELSTHILKKKNLKPPNFQKKKSQNKLHFA